MGLLDTADVLVLGIYGPPETSVATEPVYQQLDLVQQGRDITLPERSLANGALSFSSVLSLPIALDEMVPRLATALDGEPQAKVEPVRPLPEPARRHGSNTSASGRRSPGSTSSPSSSASCPRTMRASPSGR